MAKRVRDADEKFLHKRNLRLRFKKLVRAVMMNQQWLEIEDQGILMNAKKNVAFLFRQKRKTGLLTVAEKALLRSTHINRTIEERKKLCLIISGLSCFQNIPPKLRARLIPYLKFTTLGKDRVIIKNGDRPIFIYFLISGEVEMQKIIYDKNTKKISTLSEAIVGAGDLIGEVEILEKCSRLNTYVTLTTCEVLSITDVEFDEILGPFMQKQWQEKKTALRSLSYFDFFTDAQIVRACNYSQLAQYDPLESIYSEDRGAISCVHFILSGECVILQCLKIVLTNNMDGSKNAELLKVKDMGQNFYESAAKSMRSLASVFSNISESRNRISSDSAFNLTDILASLSDLDNEASLQQKKAKRKMGLREIEIACGLLKGPQISRKHRKTRIKSYIHRKSTVVPRRGSSYFQVEDESEDFIDEEDTSYTYLEEEFLVEEEMEVDTETDSLHSTRKKSTLSRQSTKNLTNKRISTLSHYSTDKQRISKRHSLPAEAKDPSAAQSPIASNSPVADQTSKQFEIIKLSLQARERSDSGTFSERSSYSTSSVESVRRRSSAKTMDTRFIDVGSLTYGGIFGLGEKMAHRTIMARTVVQCLLLPRYWLLAEEQNPGNVWKRRKSYLEHSIPSREELFGNFLKTRRWEAFKHDYVQSTLNPNSVNSTQPEDIPIICRIVETRDDS